MNDADQPLTHDSGIMDNASSDDAMAPMASTAPLGGSDVDGADASADTPSVAAPASDMDTEEESEAAPVPGMPETGTADADESKML